MADNQGASASSAARSGGTSPQPAAGTATDQTAGYDLSIDQTVSSLSDENLKYLSGTLRDLIAHRIEGINYAEGRRSQLAAIGGAIAAAGVALLPFASGVDWLPLKAVYIELSLASVALGAAIWVTYAWQTNYNYPFKTELSTWKWFYHQALPHKQAFGPGLVRNRGKKRRRSENEQYAEQWPKFTQQALGLSDPQVDATQDLKQLYQLHVNELYKNLFLSQLRTILMRGLVVVGVGAMLTFLIAWAAYDRPDSTARSEWNGRELVASATWKPTGAVRTDGLSTRDVQFRVHVALTNSSPRHVTATMTDLVMLDQHGDPLPIDIPRHPSQSMRIAPGKTVDISGYFWVAGSDRDDMRTLILK